MLSPSTTSPITDHIIDSCNVDVLFWADELKKVCITIEIYLMHSKADFLSSVPSFYSSCHYIWICSQYIQLVTYYVVLSGCNDDVENEIKDENDSGQEETTNIQNEQLESINKGSYSIPIV